MTCFMSLQQYTRKNTAFHLSFFLYRTMLQIEKVSSESNLNITQDSYDNTFDSFQFSSLVFPSCSGVGFTRHAFYKRKVTLPTGKTISLHVLRVKCAHYNKTHAVLPLAIIPYKRIT